MNEERNEMDKDLNEARLAAALSQSCSGADATPEELAALRAKLAIPRPAAPSRVRIYLFATIVAAAAAMLFAVLLGYRPSQSVETTPADDDAPGEALPPGALKRFGTPLRMERLTNESFAFSPDGKEMIAACRDGAMRVWNLQTGKERLCVHPKEKSGRFTAVRWSPDGSTVAGVADFNVYAWSADSAKEFLCEGEGLFRNGLIDISFDRSGKVLSAVCVDRQIVVWDLKAGKRILEKLNDTRVDSGTLSPDGKTLVYGESVGEKGILVFLDLASGKQTARVDAHRSWANTIRFTPDGRLIATSSHDGTVGIWNADTHELVHRMTAAGATYDAVFSPDGKTVASAGHGKTMEFWSVATGKRTRSMQLESDFEKRELAFTPDGKMLGVLTDRFSLVDLSGANESVPARGHDAGVARVAFSGDGAVLVSGSYDQTMRAWNTETGTSQCIEFPRGSPNTFAMDAGGKVMAAKLGKESIGLWNPSTCREISRVALSVEKDEWIRYLSFDAGADILFAAAENGFLRAIERSSGRVKWKRQLGRTIKGLTSGSEGLACILGKPVAAPLFQKGVDSAVVLDPETGDQRLELSNKSQAGTWFKRVLLSSAGDPLAVGNFKSSGGDCSLALFDFSTGLPCAAMEILAPDDSEAAFLDDYQACNAVSAGGRLLAEARGNTLSVWEIASGRLLERFSGHDGAMVCVALAPDGRTVATGSYDTTILLWGLGRAPAPEGLDARWAALKADAGPGTLAAVYALAGDGAQAVAYLDERLKPQEKPAPEKVKKLLVDLEDERFEVRERAASALAGLAGIEPELEAARVETGNAELRERLGKVLADIRNPVLRDAGLLQAVRGVWVLERIGSADAQNVLRRLAGGVPGARLTREAAAALARIGAGSRK